MSNFLNKCKFTWANMPTWAKIADVAIMAIMVVAAIMATMFFL